MSEKEKVLEKLFKCVKTAMEKRGSDPVILNVSGLNSFADYFLFVSGSSDRRVKTIAEAIKTAMKEEGVKAIGSEGLREGRWALIDFGPFIVHVFYEDARKIFDLEGLWSDGERVEIPQEVLKARPQNLKEEA